MSGEDGTRALRRRLAVALLDARSQARQCRRQADELHRCGEQLAAARAERDALAERNDQLLDDNRRLRLALGHERPMLGMLRRESEEVG